MPCFTVLLICKPEELKEKDKKNSHECHDDLSQLVNNKVIEYFNFLVIAKKITIRVS